MTLDKLIENDKAKRWLWIRKYHWCFSRTISGDKEDLLKDASLCAFLNSTKTQIHMSYPKIRKKFRKTQFQADDFRPELFQAAFSNARRKVFVSRLSTINSLNFGSSFQSCLINNF